MHHRLSLPSIAKANTPLPINDDVPVGWGQDPYHRGIGAEMALLTAAGIGPGLHCGQRRSPTISATSSGVAKTAQLTYPGVRRLEQTT